MQLFVGEQSRFEMVSVTNDLVEKLLVRFLASISPKYRRSGGHQPHRLNAADMLYAYRCYTSFANAALVAISIS